jgi:zinc transporter ZupT
MDQNFWIALAAGTIAAAVTTGGIICIRRYEDWARRNAAYFASFAAGVLIAVSFLHIVPTSIRLDERAPAFLFIGYLSMHLFNRFLAAYVCDKPQTADYAIGLVPLFGIGLHSFVDGIVFAIGFNVSALTGVLVAIGLILHEFPEGVVTYTLLLRSGFTARRSFTLAFAAAAATTPVGTLVSYPFIRMIDEPVLGLLLAFSAGALIYVGATHLLPHAEEKPSRFSLLALVAGALVALGIVLTKG